MLKRTLVTMALMIILPFAESSYERFCANPNDYDGSHLIPKWYEKPGDPDYTCDFWLKYLSDRSYKIDLRNPTCAMINTPIIHSDGRNKEPNLRDYLWRLSPCCGGDISNVFSWKNVDAKFAEAKLWKHDSIRETDCNGKYIEGSELIPVMLWLPGKKNNEIIISNQHMCNTESPYGVLTYDCRRDPVQHYKTCRTANCDNFKDPRSKSEIKEAYFKAAKNGECSKGNVGGTTLGVKYSMVNNAYNERNLCGGGGGSAGGIIALIVILCLCFIGGIGGAVYFFVAQSQKQQQSVTASANVNVQGQIQPSGTLQIPGMVPQNQVQMQHQQQQYQHQQPIQAKYAVQQQPIQGVVQVQQNQPIQGNYAVQQTQQQPNLGVIQAQGSLMQGNYAVQQPNQGVVQVQPSLTQGNYTVQQHQQPNQGVVQGTIQQQQQQQPIQGVVQGTI